MSTLSKAGLASTLAFMASVTAANAQDVDVIVNDDMNADLYQIAEDINIPGTSTITRGRHDRAAGVYCEWEVSASVDKKYNITILQARDPFCKAAEPSDTNQWTIGKIKNMDYFMTNQRYIVESDPANNVVVERAPNGPGAMNVVSEYRREWNFNAGTVCLEGFEGKDGEAPYIEHNYGCFDIPDNAHVDRIRATLGM